MAEKGTWAVAFLIAGAVETVYFSAGQGPLVVYRIHNDGPGDVVVSVSGGSGAQPATVTIHAGNDADISGSGIQISVSFRLGSPILTASGTYELLCCQPPAQPATAAAASAQTAASPQSKAGGAKRPPRSSRRAK